MILDVDIGNTRIKWRLSGNSVASPASSSGVTVLDELGTLHLHAAGSIRRVRVSCVAGVGARQIFDEWCTNKLSLEPEYAAVRQDVGGLSVAYAQPERLGVDRWLAMLAAHHQTDGACAVVDAGSALTVDFVNSAGEHAGGLVLPGTHLMKRSLFTQTDAVKVDALTLPQKWQPGCDTLACVENGIAGALAGFVREIIRYGGSTFGSDLTWLACGGDAATIAQYDQRLTVRPDLVLDGLSIALEDRPPRNSF